MLCRDASLGELMAMLALGQAAVCLLQLVRAWPLIRPALAEGAIGDDARHDVHSLWRFSGTVWLTGILSYALGKQTDIITLQFFRTPQAEVGFYALAVTLAATANNVLRLGIFNVSTAALATVRAEQPGRLSKGWQTLCSVSPMLSLPLLLFVTVLADPIMNALYGPQYQDAAILLQIFAAFLIVCQVLGGGIHSTAFSAMGVPKRSLQARAVTGVLNLGVNIALVPLYGARGAVVGTGACGVLTMAYEYRLLRRYLQDRLPLANIMRSGLTMLPGLVPAWFIAPHLGIIGVLVAGGVYMASYVGLLLLTRPVALDPDIYAQLPRLMRRLVRPEAGGAAAVGAPRKEPATL